MEVEVYADLLFLINAGMDGLCFGLTGRLLHRRLTPLRVMSGAMLGGIYAVISLFLDTGWGLSLGLDVAVCLLLCRLVFGGRGADTGKFWSATATYFLLSMVLGGVMTAIYNLLNRMHISDYLPQGEEGAGVWLFALVALAGGGITLLGGRSLRREASVRRCRVLLFFEGRQVALEGLVDTGNLLRDPLGGRVVICVQKEALAPFLPPELAMALDGGGEDQLARTPYARRFRLIPAGTATGDGMLAGFLPDSVELLYEHRGREEVRRVDAVVAAAELRDTEALVPAELVD